MTLQAHVEDSASGAEPSILGTPFASWGDAFASLLRFPVVFLLSFGGICALAMLNAWLALPRTGLREVVLNNPQLIQSILLSSVIIIVTAMLMVPIAFLTHRSVLLDDRTTLTGQSPERVAHFLRVALIWTLLTLLPDILLLLCALLQISVVGLVFIFFYIPILIVAIKTLILFPAIATDAPAATWRNANEDSRGHGLRILVVMILCTVPFSLWQAVTVIVYAPPGVPTFGSKMVLAGVSAALQVLATSAYAAAASRLYRSYGHRLKGAPASPTA
jgi:hypothetical protein